MKLFGLLLLVAAVSAKVLYLRDAVPQGWSKGRPAEKSHTLPVLLALNQQNLDVLNTKFVEASSPKHANYQNFMTIEEINALVRPAESERAAVFSWLNRAGITQDQIRDYSDSLEIDMTVASAETLFSTQMYEFTHENGGRVVRQYGTYSLPHEVSNYIEMVVGISTFPVPHYNVKKSKRSNGPNADLGIAPQTLAALYNIPAAVQSNVSQCVIEFEEQNFNPKDLVQFGKLAGINANPVSADHTIGPNDPKSAQLEASLDIQMITGVNQNAVNWFWIEKGDNWLYAFAVHMGQTTDLPYVNSISYGWSEADQCTINPKECQQIGVKSYGYVARVNTEWQKLGVRGVTLLSASGDSGAHGRTDPDCSAKTLLPDYPGCSPYVTSVGGTELHQSTPLDTQPQLCTKAGMKCAKSGTEVSISFAVSEFASGGGFSNVAPLMDWQKDAVQTYLKSGVVLPPATMYNASGRGYPDVAALGHNCLIYQDDAQPVDGTSCSCPIFAGIISLLNEESMSKTGKPLGFVNPLLYQMYKDAPQAFHDITVGDNRCTEDGCASSCKGFKAATGWDPVTGLGTPNYGEMLNYMKSHVWTK